MITALILGIFFGVIIQRSRVNTFNKLAGFAMLKDFTVPKVLLTAVGIGSILLFIEIQLNMTSLNIKPFDVTGVIIGAVIFGIAMAILGYCPGTLVVSAAEGAVDAIVGIFGGLLAGYVYVAAFPHVKDMLGPSLGKLNLYVQNTGVTALIVLAYGAAFLSMAFYIDRKEHGR